MQAQPGERIPRLWVRVVLLLAAVNSAGADGPVIPPSPYWGNQIAFPSDAFCSFSKEGESKWVKFTILLEPYEPNVYFQNSRKYMFHYTFATQHLTPFLGMTPAEFNVATLFEQGQRGVLGTVIFPPTVGASSEPRFREYGIQFVRQTPYTREQIRDMFHLVRAHVTAPSDVQAFYFPTYEQQEAAATQRDWLESQGVPLGSTARWTQGNACYSQGWALGTVKFFAAGDIVDAYHRGLLRPDDILLTDGVPAELPYLAGIMSLDPSTPNSHVAILARTYVVPFVHLAVADDAERARQLVGHRIIFSAYDDEYGRYETRLIDANGLLDEATEAQILQLRKPSPLSISPMAEFGALATSVENLVADDICYVGGKASNFGLLRRAVPANSPEAIALSFDLWNAFLDQPLTPAAPVQLRPGEYLLFWADEDEEQGPTHTSFKLSQEGESVGLFDVDGRTLIDSVHFPPQTRDSSYGRAADGGDVWQTFVTPTPGQPNPANSPTMRSGLVINEIMAANRRAVEDPCEAGEYPDWIELYNASDTVITLDGMFLTDDVNDPTKWQIRPGVEGTTLRGEIARRLSQYDSYPPADMQALSRDLACIRSLFTNPHITAFGSDLHEALIGVLSDPAYGFDPYAMLRFRSSTNMEDSMDFVGAGLYDSYSGCLADDLDLDDRGPCNCDPNRGAERGVFEAMRHALASFYNDNAFLERLRHDVNEAEVGMALVVHHSFPDEIELANGVATIEKKSADEESLITLVTQQGAVSVTNPEDGSIPEEVVAEALPSGYITLTPAGLKRQSSLVPVGRTVMGWPNDYRDLMNLLMTVANSFGEVTGKSAYMLDLEYKKVAPGGRVLPAGGLVIKQVRQVPVPDRTATVTPFLINVPTEFEVYSGEFELFERTDVFADHRLKSRWKLETYSMPLDPNHLSERLFARLHLEYLDEGQIRTIVQEIPLLPEASHSFNGTEAVDSWRLPNLGNPRGCHLRTTGIPMSVPKTDCPLLTPADLGVHALNLPFRCLMLEVDYSRPVISWFQHVFPSDPASKLQQTMKSEVRLWRRAEPREDDIFQERTFTSRGITVRTSFYYPKAPEGLSEWVAAVAATAPLKYWDQTVIEGLTTEPLLLKGYYSQTFRPEHHNLTEHFLFEPRLEPGIPSHILEQLNGANVRYIHMILNHETQGEPSRIMLYGPDGTPVNTAGSP